jgi:hypothetical protein
MQHIPAIAQLPRHELRGGAVNARSPAERRVVAQRRGIDGAEHSSRLECAMAGPLHACRLNGWTRVTPTSDRILITSKRAAATRRDRLEVGVRLVQHALDSTPSRDGRLTLSGNGVSDSQGVV